METVVLTGQSARVQVFAICTDIMVSRPYRVLLTSTSGNSLSVYRWKHRHAANFTLVRYLKEKSTTFERLATTEEIKDERDRVLAAQRILDLFDKAWVDNGRER
jgi:hypothetical protein